MALGWALISTGKHADALIAPAIGLAEDTQFVAVYSREQERAEAFASKHGAQIASPSLETLVADSRVDAVFIASPNFLHASYTRIAAQAGKHVLVEKPMATRVAEAVEMVRTCRSYGVHLGVGFHLRHHPGHQEARRLIADGALGIVPWCKRSGALASAGWQRYQPRLSWKRAQALGVRGGGNPSKSVAPGR